MTNKSILLQVMVQLEFILRGQSDTARNTVTNDGNITVGDTLAGGAPAVGIYAENTKLTQGDTGTPTLQQEKKVIDFIWKKQFYRSKGYS